MELMAQMAAVVGVLCLVLATTWLFRRGGAPRFAMRKRGRIVEVVDTAAISPQLSVTIVRVRGTEWVLAVHSSGVQVLQQSTEGGAQPS